MTLLNSNTQPTDLNEFLKARYFNGRISNLQQKLLNGECLEATVIEELIKTSNPLSRLKLLICYFSGKEDEHLSEALIQQASPELIARTAALTGKFNLIQQLNLETDVLRRAFRGTDTGMSVMESQGSMGFHRYLEFRLDSKTQVKDTLTIAELYQYYFAACSMGYPDVLKFIASQPHFDECHAATMQQYRAYSHAGQNQEVIEYLSSIPGFDAQKAVQTPSYAGFTPYHEACIKGNLVRMAELEKTDGYADEKGLFQAYRDAYLHGRLDVIEHIEGLAHFKTLEAALSWDSIVYLWAAQGGYLDLMHHLEAMDGFIITTAAYAHDYAPLMTACSRGHLDVVTHLQEMIPKFKDQDIISMAYRNAVLGGQLEVMKYLEKQLNSNKLAFLNDNTDELITSLCEKGKLNVIKYLNTIPGFDLLGTIIKNRYAAYRVAYQYGMLEVIDYLDTLSGFERLKATASFDEKKLSSISFFQASGHSAGYDNDRKNLYSIACESDANNVLEMLIRLESIPGFCPLEAVSEDKYKAYRLACKKGDIECIYHIESIVGFNRFAALSANDYEAYYNALNSGDLTLVRHLEQIEGFEPSKALSSQRFLTLLLFSKTPYMNLVLFEHLLENPTFFYIAVRSGDPDVSSILSAYIDMKLNALMEKQDSFHRDSPQGVFDIAQDDALQYYFILYYLIKLGGTSNTGTTTFSVVGARLEENKKPETPRIDFTSHIKNLLNIPAIQEMAHQNVTACQKAPDDKENALLRLAINHENESAKALLLEIPKINELAKAANMYNSDEAKYKDKGYAQKMAQNFFSKLPQEMLNTISQHHDEIREGESIQINMN